MSMLRTRASVLLVALVAGRPVLSGQPGGPSPLMPADIDALVDIARLEDQRRFDDVTLGRLFAAPHREVRRRAVVAVGRIADDRGRALLVPMRDDPDADIVATVAFATGQLRDPAAVGWLASVLALDQSVPGLAREAARSLGKIRTPEARTALAQYLTHARATAASRPVIGEALLSIGRFTTRDDPAPVIRWAADADVEVRWRAAWALFRPRHPAAIPHLLRLATDASPDVRAWAVRGLAAPVVAESGTSPATAAGVLRAAARDPDRRVRTEAIRALTLYDDDASLAAVLAALDDQDGWISVSAADGLGRWQTRAGDVVPKLVTATAPARPASLRMSALAPLVMLAPDAALDAASALMRSDIPHARTIAAQTLRRLGAPGQARLDALSADPATRDLVPAAPAGGGGRGAGRGGPPARPERSDADYRRLVERDIVADYRGAPPPRAVLETPRGAIELELYPGDAPFGVEYFETVVESGAIVGTAFTRLVPNFVAQQQAIASDPPLRDEVSRRGLTRGNLSWASSGLDTGRPGYTLATAPHPHIEGDFTALGRVVRGLEVIDRLELGDRITSARMVR